MREKELFGRQSIEQQSMESVTFPLRTKSFTFLFRNTPVHSYYKRWVIFTISRVEFLILAG